MVCRVVSRDRDQREHMVLRTENDISTLYAGMVDKFMIRGCVVLPPPKGKRKLLARYARFHKVGAVRADETGSVNITRMSTTPILPIMAGDQCARLQLYLRCLARHPILGNDSQFRHFLEQQDMVEVYKLPYRDKVAERFMRMADKFSM